jgi:hypothetical protein
MDAREFYKALRALKHKGWVAQLDEKGWIRLGPSDPPKSLIRDSPITAVCLELKNKRFHWVMGIEAGQKLGLTKRFTLSIHLAATNRQERGRKTLMRNLGLAA